MSDEKQEFKSPPAVLPWVVGVISLVIVLFGALFIIETVSQVKRLYTFHNLSEDLKEANFALSVPALGSLLHPFSFSHSLGLDGETEEHAQRKQDRISTIEELHEVIVRLEENDFSTALVKFNVLSDRRLGQLLSAYSEKGDSVFIQDIKEGFSKYHEKIKALEQTKEEVPKRIEENLFYVRQNVSFSESLIREIGDFFALTPAQEDFEGTEIDLYELGVLKGLPPLKGLADDLSTLVDLKSKLEVAGGSVKMTGIGAKEKFEQKIEAYRSSLEHYTMNIKGLLSENSKLEDDLSEMKLSIFKEGKKLQEKLIALLLSAVKPASSPLAVLIFRQTKPVFL